MKYLLIPITSLVLLSACSESTTPTVTETNAPEVTISKEMADAGKKLYGENCGGCHKLKTVDDYSMAQWDKILPNMAKKSRLQPEQTASIYNYIKWELKN